MSSTHDSECGEVRFGDTTAIHTMLFPSLAQTRARHSTPVKVCHLHRLEVLVYGSELR